MLSGCRSFLTGLLQYFAKYMAILVHGFWGEILLLSKSVFGYFKALVGWPLKITFFAASLRYIDQLYHSKW